MKNIHLIPTDQQSKLYVWEDELRFGDLTTAPKNLGVNNQFIYITNEVKINTGDWCVSLCDDESYGEIYQCKGIILFDIEDKKIVLTNDPTLISDGVQEIDNEFLQWYVSNSDCEFVEVGKDNYFGIDNWRYLIKIPQEKTEHKGKSLTTEEVMEGRSSAYNFLDFNDSPEKENKTEKLYTEKEVLKILNVFNIDNYSPVEKNDIFIWFKQFKK